MDQGGCAAHRQHQAVLMARETEEVNTLVISEFAPVTEQRKPLLSGITKVARHDASSCLQIPINMISEANSLGPNQVILDETAILAKLVPPLLLLHDIPQVLLQSPCWFSKLQVQLGRKEVMVM